MLHNGLICRNKFLMYDAFVVEKGDKQCFDIGLLQRTLFWSLESRWTPRHRLPFWFRIELVAPDLFRDDVFQKQWIQVTHRNEVSRSLHPFCFLLVCELVLQKSGADLPLTKSSRTMVCAVSLLMPYSSAINLSGSRRTCRTVSIFSGVLFVDGRPERDSSSVVSFPSRKRLNHS